MDLMGIAAPQKGGLTMRENIVLYRGKRIDNGEWVVGSLIYDAENNRVFIVERFEAKQVYMRNVDLETVGQYTGLTDKNGKKIFEGDILALNKWKPYYVVKFEDGTFCMVGTAIPIRHANKFEVIGNIYDNPELLKGGADHV